MTWQRSHSTAATCARGHRAFPTPFRPSHAPLPRHSPRPHKPINKQTNKGCHARQVKQASHTNRPLSVTRAPLQCDWYRGVCMCGYILYVAYDLPCVCMFGGRGDAEMPPSPLQAAVPLDASIDPTAPTAAMWRLTARQNWGPYTQTASFPWANRII